MQSPLNESASVVLDASGNGTLRMVPYSGSLTWLPSVVSVKASSAAAEAQCRNYIGADTSDQWFVDGTLSGSSGDSTDAVTGRQVDTHGNALWAVWTGGDPGAVATMTVAGTESRP
jgi:hypothetical protein